MAAASVFQPIIAYRKHRGVSLALRVPVFTAPTQPDRTQDEQLECPSTLPARTALAPATGCKFAASAASCSDGNTCTAGDKCALGKCGDGVLMTLQGEECNDGNTTAKDGCGATCKVEDTACADGTREGLMDKVRYPTIAQCNGNWYGSIGSTNGTDAPNQLCGLAFHVCNSSAAGQTNLKSITQPDAF